MKVLTVLVLARWHQVGCSESRAAYQKGVF